MGRFTPARGLGQRVAEMVRPDIARITEAVADGAKEAAPAEKIWLADGAAPHRPEHAAAHGQAVPENLRFTLRSPDYDRSHYGAGAIQMGRQPRDEDGFTPGNTANCNCSTRTDGEGVARTIVSEGTTVAGSTVTGRVVCTHRLGAESNDGNTEDVGAHFMEDGLRAGARAIGG